jgi:hypothetical protein
MSFPGFKPSLSNSTCTATSRLKRAQRIAKMVYEKSSDCKLMMCGSLLVVVLVLLLVLVLKKF